MNKCCGRIRCCSGQQNLFASFQSTRQYPSLRSNNHCSLLTTKKATMAVKKPTMVTIIHPKLLSNAKRRRARILLRFLSLEKRTESLMASCSQSMDEKEEYQTRTPLILASMSVSEPVLVDGTVSYAEIGRWTDVLSREYRSSWSKDGVNVGLDGVSPGFSGRLRGGKLGLLAPGRSERPFANSVLRLGVGNVPYEACRWPSLLRKDASELAVAGMSPVLVFRAPICSRRCLRHVVDDGGWPKLGVLSNAGMLAEHRATQAWRSAWTYLA